MAMQRPRRVQNHASPAPWRPRGLNGGDLVSRVILEDQSRRIKPAIHIQYMAGDEAGIRRGEKNRGGRNFSTLTITLQRNSVEIRAPHSRRVGAATLLGIDRARRDCIHAYAASRKFDRHDARQLDHARFSCAVRSASDATTL